ncbi:MAG: hypothetical protein ACOC33_02885 [bacterium]
MNYEKLIRELVDKKAEQDNQIDLHAYENGMRALVEALSIADVSGMLSDQTKRYIDLAYLTGAFNVSGIDGLQRELTRLKEIGKNPHDIFA